MKYREMGKTGIRVSEIGFGTWGIGGATPDGPNSYGVTDDRESKRALRRAFELGINFYDTSNIYGYGHAEQLLGEAFKNDRDKIVIASKVGFLKHGGPHDISPKYIRKCLEESLSRLSTDYVDLYQLHSPPIDLLHKTPEAVDELKKLKEEGKIRAFGFSVKNPQDGIVAIEKYGFEVIQVNFNMIDERALECGLFDAAERYHAGVIARTPFAFGFLTGTIKDVHFDSKDHRSTWPEAQLRRWQEAPAVFMPFNKDKNRTIAEFALQFCLGFDVISSVIPGILHPHEAEENAKASDFPRLSSDVMHDVIEAYKSHEFFDKSLKQAKQS